MANSTRLRALLSQSSLVQGLRDLPIRISPPQSFAQHSEDRFILETVLADRSLRGAYIDIGASHPARLSNTYLLYLNGWRGLIVEPITALLRLHRRWRPLDIQVQSLIGQTDGSAIFYQLFPSVLSTTSEQDLQEQLANGSLLLRKDKLPQLTLATLIERYLPDRPIDLISIDVEGIDGEIARQIVQLPEKRRPFSVCIEANTPKVAAELRSTLGLLYHKSAECGCNLIFWN